MPVRAAARLCGMHISATDGRISSDRSSVALLSRSVDVQRHSKLPIPPPPPPPPPHLGMPTGQELIKTGTTGCPDFAEHISESAGWIYTVRSSLELSKPVVVQHHGLVPLTLDIQGKLLKKPSHRNRRANWHETKGCESVGSGTHFVALNLDLSHDIYLEFSRSNFVVFQECCISGMGGSINTGQRNVSR